MYFGPEVQSRVGGVKDHELISLLFGQIKGQTQTMQPLRPHMLWVSSSFALVQLTTIVGAWSGGFWSARQTQHTTICQAANECSDFEEYGEDDTDDPSSFDFQKALQERSVSSVDYSAIQTRQFSLGSDLVVSDYLGNMGFDEGTSNVTAADARLPSHHP